MGLHDWPVHRSRRWYYDHTARKLPLMSVTSRIGLSLLVLTAAGCGTEPTPSLDGRWFAEAGGLQFIFRLTTLPDSDGELSGDGTVTLAGFVPIDQLEIMGSHDHPDVRLVFDSGDDTFHATFVGSLVNAERVVGILTGEISQCITRPGCEIGDFGELDMTMIRP